MKKRLIAGAMLVSIASFSVARVTDKAHTSQKIEKCYGVARAEKNDCSAKDGSNSCAGYSMKDRDENTWVYVPKGLCDKLAGGVKG